MHVHHKKGSFGAAAGKPHPHVIRKVSVVHPLMITNWVPLMRGVVTVLAISRSVAETNITQRQNQP